MAEPRQRPRVPTPTDAARRFVWEPGDIEVLSPEASKAIIERDEKLKLARARRERRLAPGEKATV